VLAATLWRGQGDQEVLIIQISTQMFPRPRDLGESSENICAGVLDRGKGVSDFFPLSTGRSRQSRWLSSRAASLRVTTPFATGIGGIYRIDLWMGKAKEIIQRRAIPQRLVSDWAARVMKSGGELPARLD